MNDCNGYHIIAQSDKHNNNKIQTEIEANTLISFL